MECPHDNVDHLVSVRDADRTLERLMCLDCGASVPFGPSNDKPKAVQLEIGLARLLAEFEHDCEPLEAAEIVIDIFATDDPPNPNLRPAGRPLSPIEIMVDRACGVDRG